jgi:5-methylcytosine-specific restriction enzyme A
MQDATPEQVGAFRVFYSSMINKSASLEMDVSGNTVDIADGDWPEQWETVEISMRRGPFFFDIQSPDSIRENIYPWIKRFYALILSLLPLEFEEQEHLIRPEKEGGAIEATVKRYERSRINRAACIEIYGAECQVCDFNFKHRYGYIGEGFIHVHHIVPLSTMGGAYELDPAKDLVPVCPNCHAMLHKKKPTSCRGIERNVTSINFIRNRVANASLDGTLRELTTDEYTDYKGKVEEFLNVNFNLIVAVRAKLKREVV